MDSLARLQSSTDHFDIYNFHQSDILDSLEEAIGYPSRSAAIALLGERGIGRTYLLDASARRLRAKGKSVSVLHLDAEGYEPDQDLSTFIQYKTRKHGLTDRHWSADSLGINDPHSEWAALVVALLCSRTREYWKTQAIDLGDSNWRRLEDRDKLFSLLKSLTADQFLVLHVEDVCHISSPVLEALNAQAEAIPNLVLAVSGGSNDFARQANLHHLKVITTVRLTRLSSDQLQGVLDRNFLSNVFPARFAKLLWKASLGIPSVAAALMHDFVFRGLINREQGKPWRIADEAVFSEMETLQSSSDIAGNLLAANASASGFGRLLPQYLFLAGLCQENIPASLILQHLGLERETADVFLDFIDQAMIEDIPLFTDFQYGHPSFPRQVVYQFTSSIARQAALDSVTPAEGARLASDFFNFLKAHLCADTRGACTLLLCVASALGLETECKRNNRELAWWVGKREAEQLTNLLVEAITSNQIAPESIWCTFEDTVNRWPAYRRMSLLDAYLHHPDRIPKYRMSELRYARARLLRDSGRTDESVGEALSALDLLKDGRAPEPIIAAGCHALIAGEYSKSGSMKKAQQHMACALTSSAEIRERRHPLLVSILHEIAGQLQAFGDDESARSLLESALEIANELYGHENIGTADLLKNLADVLRNTGDLEGACGCLERTLEINQRIYGSESPKIGIIHKILADDLRALGKPQPARDHLEQALKIEIKVNDAGSEDASLILNHLADLSEQVGDFKAACHYLQRSLSIEEALHGGASPRLAVQVKRLADMFWSLGDAEGTVTCLERALSIEETVYGKSDRRILQNLAYLEATLRELGRAGAANEYLQRLRSIEHQEVI